MKSNTGLSKSRFLLGSQCHRLLYWTVQEPKAAELEHDAATEVIFEQGHLVGDEARRRFPGGVLVDLPHTDVDARIERTRELMLREDVPAIFEASFLHEGVFVAVDVLVRDVAGWELVEVKCTTRVKDEHLLDVALQRHVLASSGVDVRRVLLMHLSRACVFPDLADLFETADVTEAAVGFEVYVAAEARAQRAMLAGDVPAVDVGDHCSAPRACPFMSRCHSALPEHHVSSLYSIGKKAGALVERGFETLHDLDGTVRLSVIGRRQVRAVKSNRVVVEPGLAPALDALVGPLAFFDLETVAFAIPRFHGCRPWDSVPAQASIHVDEGEHHAFLADTDEDPRPALARFVIEHLRDAGTILAWNASFERRCLTLIGEAFPEFAAELDDVCARLVDLLSIVRGNVYHPHFHGSFSLKSVAPALVPGFGYDDLDIAGGGDATAALFRLFVDAAITEEEREAMRAYCAQDTIALVHIMAVLRGLVVPVAVAA